MDRRDRRQSVSTTRRPNRRQTGMTSPRTRRRQTGMTITELLISMTVLAVVIGWVMIAFTDQHHAQLNHERVIEAQHEGIDGFQSEVGDRPFDAGHRAPQTEVCRVHQFEDCGAHSDVLRNDLADRAERRIRLLDLRHDLLEQ